MTVSDTLSELLAKRIAMDPDIPIDYDRDPLILGIIELFVQHPQEVKAFLKNDCTETEFSYLSEIFDDIATASQNRDYVDCFNELAKKYPEETKKYNIQYFIDDMENFFD